MKNTYSQLLLKGSMFTLTVMQVPTADLSEFSKRLEITVNQAPAFFKHAPIILDLQLLEEAYYQDEFLPSIIHLLRKHQIFAVGIRGGNSDIQSQAIESGLAIFPVDKSDPKQKPHATTTPTTEEKYSSRQQTPPPAGNISRLVTQPVRSGQKIYAKNGDLIITAPVSHGAEVMADGNIHVYGPLRGRALAGVMGDTSARIFCMGMEAQLIAIAGQYLVNEQSPDSELGKQEGSIQIYLDNGHLQISPL